MRIGVRSIVLLIALSTIIFSCKPQERARVRALEGALEPLGKLEITTGSRITVGRDSLSYLKRFEAAQLITIAEVSQDYWGSFATQTFMEGARPYSIAPTQRLAQLALNPRPASTSGIDLPLAKVKEDLESSWNFYKREVIYLGLNLLGNTTSFARPEGTPPASLTLMSDFPTYQALAQKGLLLLEDAAIPPDAYSRAKLERAVRVSITPEGERLAQLDRKASTATFVFGTYRLENVLVNTPVETSAGVYRLVEGTHICEPNPAFADLWTRLGWPTYRERRFRTVFAYKGSEGRDGSGKVTISPPVWSVAVASNGQYSAEDVGPRDGAYESSNVPPTVDALRGQGAGGDDRYTWRVHLADPKVGEVLRDDEYKGPLATPGEAFRLVLASVRHIPSAGKGPIPADLTALLPGKLRSVLKYDAFKKSWAVVALDVGPAESDTWLSSNVR